MHPSRFVKSPASRHDSISVRPTPIGMTVTQEPIGQKRERKAIYRFSARIFEDLTINGGGGYHQFGRTHDGGRRLLTGTEHQASSKWRCSRRCRSTSKGSLWRGRKERAFAIGRTRIRKRGDRSRSAAKISGGASPVRSPSGAISFTRITTTDHGPPPARLRRVG